jgi:hypothetical protein
MADAPTKMVVNCSTGETQIIPLTSAEIAQRDQDAAAFAAAEAERAEAATALAALKASAKAKLIAGRTSNRGRGSGPRSLVLSPQSKTSIRDWRLLCQY